MAARLGEQVHYVSHGSPDGTYPSTCRVAFVLDGGTSAWRALCVLNPTGMFFDTSMYSTGAQPGGTWHFSFQCLHAQLRDEDDEPDTFRRAEWATLPDVCLIYGCSNVGADVRGPVFLRDGSMHKACTPHWEAITMILGKQVVAERDDEPDVYVLPDRPVTKTEIDRQ